MGKDELNETLRQLKAELESVSPADDLSRERLRKLDAEIHRILETSGEIPPDHGHGLRESLENSITYLEASHPTATTLVSRVLKALSDMGI